jgi:hypothetical protein
MLAAALFSTFTLLASSPPAFEGELPLSVVVDGRPAEGRVVRSAAGDLRVDLDLPVGGSPVPTSLIVPASNDDVLVHAVHPLRVFERHTMGALRAAKGRYAIKALGEGKVAGRAVRGFEVVDGKSGDRFEVWLDPSLSGGQALARIHEQLQPTMAGVWPALASAGAKGFPLRLVWERRHGGRVEVAVLQVRAQEVPPRAFELPRDYKRAPAGGARDPLGSLQRLMKGK